MKRYLTFSAGILLLISFVLISCKQDTPLCSDDEAFCSFIANQDYDATGPLIDAFLADLSPDNPSDNLDQLADWLACKSCVENVSLICNSCIQTLPAQSELSVDYMVNGQTTSMVLDIIMDDTLRYGGHH